MKSLESLLIVAVLVSPSTAGAAGTPEQQCQAAKNKAAGAYASCGQKAEAAFATSGDGAKFAAALGKCDAKLTSAWQRAIDKAAGSGSTCLDAPLTLGDFQTVISAHTENVATALGGVGLTNCSADLAACASDLSSCTADLGSCTTDLTHAEIDLANCTTDLATARLCGNGIIDSDEACDFGTLNGETCITQGFSAGILTCGAGCEFDTGGCYVAATATPTPAATSIPGPLVFLSSTLLTSGLGGLDGADATCNDLASAAGLSGSYKAWLADSTGSPSTRFTRSVSPYRLVDGTMIASNWDDLTDGVLVAPINLTETGVVRTEYPTWTDVATDGQLFDANSHCNNWSGGTSYDSGGGVGGSTFADFHWTVGQQVSCGNGNLAAIYCFGQ